jgi:CheY-like chemotaxis protein
MEEKKKVILLAEDDPFLINIFSQKLSVAGFEVVSAEDGEMALEKIISCAPDLILLDNFMPKLNGMEVLRKIKSQEETKNIPVIMFTNANERENVDEAMKLGADDYLVKASFTPQEVLDIVNKFLEK